MVNGELLCIQTSSTNLQWTEAFLKQFKKHYPNEQHAVVWDGAGFHPHHSEHPNVPEGVHIVTLPLYSPELNPIEKLWDLLQDQTANKLWRSIERLEQAVANHLRVWWEHLQANASAK